MFDIFKPVLSDRTIMRYNKKGNLIEGEIHPDQLQPNSVDLTLARTWKKLIPNVPKRGAPFWCDKEIGIVDTASRIEYDSGVFHTDFEDINRKPINYYVLQPSEFVLMASREILNIPNGILCFVQGRSSIARLGIQTEQAGLIDAGFRGTITFEVNNQSDQQIILYEGMRIAQVYFFKAQKAATPYGERKGSKYSDQIEATGSEIHKDQIL